MRAAAAADLDMRLAAAQEIRPATSQDLREAVVGAIENRLAAVQDMRAAAAQDMLQQKFWRDRNYIREDGVGEAILDQR